jgi:hypothetical protein
MTHDPWKWCRDCQKTKRREGFRRLPAMAKDDPHRDVCEDCYRVILAKRSQARKRAAA